MVYKMHYCALGGPFSIGFLISILKISLKAKESEFFYDSVLT